jgi:superfamily II DNA or RNA helicase
MVSGLSKLEIGPGESLPVGESNGWVLSVTADGAILRPAEGRGLFTRQPRISENVRTHLSALADQGYCTPADDGFFFSIADMRGLREEDRRILYGYCGWLPCEVELSHRHNLGHPEFALQIDFRVGGRHVYPELLGPFARLEGSFYLLTNETQHLLSAVASLNDLPTRERALLPRVLQKWAAVDSAAAAADAREDAYLAGERVVVPEKVKLDVVTDDTGRVSVVPAFDGVAEESMQKAYLRENDVHDVYHVDARGGGRLRVVMSEDVKGVLEAVREYRRLTPRERDRLFSRPEELLGDGVAPNVVDLTLYGPRVRAIGEYPATVRPFSGERRAWDDLGGESESAEVKTDAPRPCRNDVGLSMEFDDGSASHEVFDRAEEAEELLEKVERAIREDSPVVEFRGKRLRADEALRDAVRQCVEKFQKTETAAPSDTNEAVKARSKAQGPLVYENIEEHEYSEEDIHVGRRRTVDKPAALNRDVVLRPHQEVGFEWMAKTVLAGKHGGLLADDMGLGKTLQALLFLAWLIEKDPIDSGLSRSVGPYEPVLVVAPVILLEVWRDEIHRFFNEAVFLPYEILDSSALSRLRKDTGREGAVGKSVLDLKMIRRNRLVISNYDAVANYGFSFAQIRWSAVITDEAHQFKEPSTRVSQVMKSLNTAFRLAMTGTPVVNRLLDVWNLVDFLRPLLLGTQKEFRDTYELKAEDGGPVEGARRLQQTLHVATRPPVSSETIVLRRSKEDELPGLPEKRENVIECPLSETQRREYVTLVTSIAESGGQGKMFRLLSSLNKLLQHPALVGLVSFEAETAELVSSSPKLAALLRKLAEIRSRGEKSLIFAIYIDMQNILKRVIDREFGLNVKIVNGATSEAGSRVRRRRLEVIKEFSESPGFDVLILSPDVAGVGLTITAANHVFHYGRWWNPAREDQATDRTYRIGQERPVYVTRLVSTDPLGEFKTFDEHLDALISERRRTADQFLTPIAGEDELGANLAGKVLEAKAVGGATTSTRIEGADAIARLSPDRFEALVAAWFEREGHHTCLTPYAGDAGVDVLAINDKDVLCIQVKHVARSGNKLDESAVAQARNGASHYGASILPAPLERRRRRVVVVSNGRASRALESEARKYGVEFIGGGEFVRRLGATVVTTADLVKAEAERYPSLKELRGALAERYR